MRIDLAARSLGGGVICASDESFGDKESLVLDAAPTYEPGRFGPKVELVDGWETRRRRAPGHDWAMVRLGAPGVIEAVDIDTSHFTGNFPTHGWVEACGVEGHPSLDDLKDADWHMIVERTPLGGDAQHVLEVKDNSRYTHVRLSIAPDGGVARLRVLGRSLPDPLRLDGFTPDLASRELGAVVENCSDSFYTHPEVLTLPGPARSMGEGWQTRRRRTAGHDWVVIRLAAPGRVRVAEVDTSYFVYNASSAFELWGVGTDDPSDAWQPLLRRTTLQPDTRHRFVVDTDMAVAKVRLDVFPDGGLARLRLWGQLSGAGRRAVGVEWFNALPPTQAIDVLVGRCGLDWTSAASLVVARPLPTGDGLLGALGGTHHGGVRALLAGA